MRAPLAMTVVALGLALPLAVGQTDAAQPTGAGVTIAVLDTGVDSTHPELQGRVTRQSFAEPGTPVPLPGGLRVPFAEDPDGQGTAVASVAAGSTIGVAKAAGVLDLQVSAKYTEQGDAVGVPSVDPVTEAAAIEAMDSLLRDPGRARVVLLSFAQAGVSDSGGRTLAQQARGLWDAGVLVIVPTSPSPNQLSTAPHILTVAGLESCPNAIGLGPSLKPDLVARSQGVEAAQPGDGINPGGRAPASGTAYAAAQVAGAAALLVDAFPDLPVDAVAAYLRDAATDAGDPGPDTCTGFGVLDVEVALQWAAMWDDPLASSGGRSTPGLAAPVLLAGLAAAAWAGRRDA